MFVPFPFPWVCPVAAAQLPDTTPLSVFQASFLFFRWDLSSWPISMKLPKSTFHPLEFVYGFPKHHCEISSLVGSMALWFWSDFGGAVLSQTSSVPEC